MVFVQSPLRVGRACYLDLITLLSPPFLIRSDPTLMSMKVTPSSIYSPLFCFFSFLRQFLKADLYSRPPRTSRPFHPGPQGIPLPYPFKPGHVISIEPGYYLEGEWGMRHESAVVVEKKKVRFFVLFF
jgi:hypothetical protein